jgi:hypothetical protein
MNPSGYSGTPLAKKLGIKSGFRLKIVNQPDYYFSLFSDLPTDISINEAKTKYNFIHFFTKSKTELEKLLPQLKKQIASAGMIWISWPKKASKIQTDITENVIRDFALKIGLVDIKVAAIDETWSALKLVIPVKDRVEAKK